MDVDVKTLKYEIPFSSFAIESIMVRDIDDDGSVEIIMGPDRGKIQCFRAADGELLWEQPENEENVRLLACEDFDLDGTNEIWWSSAEDDQSIAFRMIDTHTLTTDWTTLNSPGSFRTAAVADIDQDGGNEIIAVADGCCNVMTGPFAYIFDAVTHQCIHVHEFDSNVDIYGIYIDDFLPEEKGLEIFLKRANHQPATVNRMYTYEPVWQSDIEITEAIPADFEGDGIPDIYASKNVSFDEPVEIVVLDARDGSVKWSSGGISESREYTYGMDVSDIDQDGINEIGLSTENHVYIVDGDTGAVEWMSDTGHFRNFLFGDLFPEVDGTEIIYDGLGYEITVRDGIHHDELLSISLDGWTYINALEVVDFDGNGIRELLVWAQDRLYLFDTAGNLVWSSDNITNISDYQRDIISGDFNGDGVQEVLLTTETSLRELRYGSAGTGATPDCPATGVYLDLPRATYTAADPFYLTARVCNTGETLLQNHHIVILLDVYGEYWSLPSWMALHDGLDSYRYPIPPGGWRFDAVPMFLWPEVQGAASGIAFWGAILDPGMANLVGEVGHTPFGWN